MGGIMKEKILVVDDEKDICLLLKESLEMEEYSVITANCANEAKFMLYDKPDLILLDVNMPDVDGFSFCEENRDNIECPIIFLTARIEEQDRIKGFKVGGDDYVQKPFSIEELVARVNAHLRREARKNNKGKLLIVGDLKVDFLAHKITRNDVRIELTKTEYDIVELLLTYKNQVFDKEKIYETVRGYDGDADASIITEHIRRIRKKLGKYNNKEYIETVWGVGYRWIG